MGVRGGPYSIAHGLKCNGWEFFEIHLLLFEIHLLLGQSSTETQMKKKPRTKEEEVRKNCGELQVVQIRGKIESNRSIYHLNLSGLFFSVISCTEEDLKNSSVVITASSQGRRQICNDQTQQEVNSSALKV